MRDCIHVCYKHVFQLTKLVSQYRYIYVYIYVYMCTCTVQVHVVGVYGINFVLPVGEL